MYLSSAAGLGGAERVLLDVIASVRQSEPDWQLAIISGENGPLMARAAEMGVAAEVILFPARLGRLGDFVQNGGGGLSMGKLAQALQCTLGFANYVHRLRDAITNVAPDVVHANGFKMHILGAWACRRDNSLLWHVHDYVSSRPLMSRLFRLNARRCVAILANSRSVANDVLKFSANGIPVHAVLNGVDLETFSPVGPRLDLDALAGLASAPEGTVRVGLIATMAKWKGQEVFLKALAMLPKELPVRGYVIGGGIYSTDGSQYDIAELKALAHRLGIQVGFTGFIDNLGSAIRPLDVVVHASTAPEPFGRVIAEAMACGKPVIASKAGGAAEIVTAGVNAMFHLPSDAVGLMDQIATLANDPALRKRMGEAGRASAEIKFDRARQGAEIIRIYNSAVSSRV